jgi:hypothetical protein
MNAATRDTLYWLRKEAEFKRRLLRGPQNDVVGSPSESRELDHFGKVAAERARLAVEGRLDPQVGPLKPVRELHLIAEQQRERRGFTRFILKIVGKR